MITDETQREKGRKVNRTEHPHAGLRALAVRAALGALLALVLLAAPASATVYSHPFLSEFGPDGTASTLFQRGQFIAVDQGSHDVYVADLFANKVYRFDSGGAPHDFTAGPGAGTNGILVPSPNENLKKPPIVGLAVAPPGSAAGTAGDLYLAWTARSISSAKYSWGVEVYSPQGAHLATLDGSGNPHHSPTESFKSAHPCSVAADSAGDVYVSYCQGQPEPTHVDKYVPSANPVANGDFDSEIVGLDNYSGFYYSLAATGSTLYTMGYREGATYSLSLFPGGGASADVSGEGTPLSAVSQSFAVDGSSGDLYLGEGNSVLQLDEAGEKLSLIPKGATGIGVDEASGKVYASSRTGTGFSSRTRIYGAAVPVAPPTAAVDPPSSVTYKSAHLSGTVGSGGAGEGEETTYRFRCTPACSGLEGTRSVPTDGAPHAVSDDAEGLAAETSYEVKLVATNGYGLQTIEDATTFETAPKPPVTAPAATIDPVSAVSAESAHLSGTVDPMGSGEGQATTYRFEYTADGLKWIALEDQGTIEGSGPQAVSAELTGLTPNSSYSVRLHAENDGGAATSAGPNPSFTTSPVPPAVEIAPATDVLVDSAQLNGHVDPRNSHTTYYFEWGPADCATAACASIPASRDTDAGSGAAPVPVHAHLDGLSPSTTYHYRLVAASPAGEVASDGATLLTAGPQPPCESERVGFSASLPGCRAYEMVSPLEKGGADVATLTFRTQAAEDGNAVSFVSQGAFAGAKGYPYSGAEYLSSRDSGGWSTHSITPLKKSPEFVNFLTGSMYVGAMSPDLGSGVYRALAPNPDASPNVAGFDNLFLATGMRAGQPHFTLLSDSVKPLGDEPYDPNGPHIALVGASAGFGHVVFEDSDSLTADASGTSSKLYEWSAGEVRLAGVLPDGACGSPPCVASEAVGGAGVVVEGYGGWGTDTEAAHAVSEDGSRVFFTAGSLQKAEGDVGFEGSLYVREDGARTTQLDASERSAPDPAGPGRSEFQWASPAGDEVLFLSREELVDSDTDGEGVSLYRWRADAPAGARLTLVPTPGTTPLHIVDVSEDGSIVYLLGETQTSQAEYERTGEHQRRTIYVLHGGRLRRVAALDARDPQVGENGMAGEAARMTPDGRELLFHSYLDLTGYDPHNPDCKAEHTTGFGKPEQCLELYVYSFDADEVLCASCDPSGEPPTGEGVSFLLPVLDTGLLGGYSPYLTTPISSDGRYVFFTSPDPLVRRDVNGRLDAYVYDVPRREVRLLSSGQCNCDSAFLTAGSSGRDAFFTTRQQLVRADTDNLSDLYDARVDGGIAAQNALPPAECQGDSCQPVASSPAGVTPASATFRGPDDASPQPRRCARAARKAARLRRRARRLVRRSERASARRRRPARGAQRRARRLSRQAHRLSGRAHRCRARRHKRSDHERRAQR